MKKSTFHRFSITGLLLAAVSGITMTLSAKHNVKMTNNGVLLASDGELDVDFTCELGFIGIACTYTEEIGTVDGIGSRTSSEIVGSSSMTTTNGMNKVKTISTVYRGGLDVVTKNGVDTSEDEDNI